MSSKFLPPSDELARAVFEHTLFSVHLYFEPSGNTDEERSKAYLDGVEADDAELSESLCPCLIFNIALQFKPVAQGSMQIPCRELPWLEALNTCIILNQLESHQAMENEVREMRRQIREREPLAHEIESASKIRPASSTCFYALWQPLRRMLDSYKEKYHTDRDLFELLVKPVFERRQKEAFWHTLVLQEPLLPIEDGQYEAMDSTYTGSDVVRSPGPSTNFINVTPNSWKSEFNEMKYHYRDQEYNSPLSTTRSASTAPLCPSSRTSANKQSLNDDDRLKVRPPPPPSSLPPRTSDYAPPSSIATSKSTSGSRTIASDTTSKTHVSFESSSDGTSRIQFDK